MKRLFSLVHLALLVLTVSGCGRALSPTVTPVPPTATPPPTETPVSAATPTNTSIPPTETPASTATSTATPVPPTPTLAPPTDTVCATGCDFATIQAAIDDPNTADGAIIEITDPVHTEAGIVVDKNVTIRGLGADETIVQAHAEAGSATDRVFLIAPGADVTIKNIKIRHGYPSSSPHAGGGIWNQGTLTLQDSRINSNTAADGGGIWNQGQLTATNCTIGYNMADGIAPPGLECGSGGGINNGGGGRLLLIDSSVINNRAEGKSGGIHVACESTVTLFNSTISGNRAVSYGGGAFIGPIGTLKLNNSTISDNGTNRLGGGVYIRGTLHYTETVIAGCVIGGEGGYKGMGRVGIQNNSQIEDNDCKPQ
jgi:hypothetical protein